MSLALSRREFFAGSAAAMAVANVATAQEAKPSSTAHPFTYCLNTSTIRECQYQGKKVDILAGIDVASKAGYSGIEPWIGELDRYVKDGGSLADLKKRIADAGILFKVRVFATHMDRREKL